MPEVFKYGRTTVRFNIPRRSVVLKVKEPEQRFSREQFISEIQEYLPNDTLSYANVGIVVADKTRICEYDKLLPWLLEELEKRGAKKDSIRIYVAYGTHAAQSEEESENAYGASYNNYTFVHHDCDDDVFIQLGTTSYGTPVRVRHDVVSSSLIIAIGAISYHYFAGYGGGRKLLFPGLASRESIYANHSLFLDKEAKALAPGCQPGKLEGNPIAEDLKEIDGLMPMRLSIHGLLNSKGELANLIVGNSYIDFENACKVHDSYFRIHNNRQYDLVLASVGGYPKDINFIQAHKAIHHASEFVKDGAKLIMLCECIDGIASQQFMQYIQEGSTEAIFSTLMKKYEGNGGTAMSMMAKSKRIHIYLITELERSVCDALNVIKISMDDVQRLLDEETGSIGVIGNASVVLR